MSSLLSSTAQSWPAIAGDGFGEPFDAFPVEAEFAVRPDLVKLVPRDDWLRVDREWPRMAAAKLSALSGTASTAPAGNVMLASPGSPAVERRRLAAVMRACEALAATTAGARLGVRCDDGAVSFKAAGYRAALISQRLRLDVTRPDAEPVVRALESAGEASRLLGALAMSLQEDLVLMEQDSQGVVRAVLFHVSFPSAWDPGTKLGQDLLALHAPVADNEALQAAAGRLAQALIAKGPFVRWVWTVTADDRWRAWPPPAFDAPTSNDAEKLYFRLERQTTMPLGDGFGLFLIRVRLRPLDDVLAAPGRRALLQASLRSMSEAMVRYKNLGAVRARLLAA